MPGRDGTGPDSRGPLTGRGRGECISEAKETPFAGLGRGLGLGRRGCRGVGIGRGRGLGRGGRR